MCNEVQVINVNNSVAVQICNRVIISVSHNHLNDCMNIVNVNNPVAVDVSGNTAVDWNLLLITYKYYNQLAELIERYVEQLSHITLQN